MALFVGSTLLPGSPGVAPADAARVQDAGLLANQTVKTFERTLLPTQTSRNTTILVPLNASATILSAQVNVSGRFFQNFINLSGRGGPARDGEGFGQSMHGKGDYNDDGYPDIAIGAEATGTAGAQQGRVDVFYGSSTGIRGRDANWSYLGPSQAGFGASITHGDYNGDGIDDLVVGESDSIAFGITETVFIFYGSASGPSTTPSVQLVFNSTVQTQWGWSLAGGIDINKDSYDDLVVGEPSFDDGITFIGRVTVLWGSAAGLNVTDYTAIEGSASAQFGYRVQALGDTDGDGLAEFAVGSPVNNTNSGSVDVFEGVDGTKELSRVWNLAGSGGEYFGWTLAGGADLTGDGKADLVVGAPVYNTLVGAVYIFNGTGNASYSSSFSYRLLPVSGTVEQFGAGMDIVGDIDGDGTQDLAVGGNRYNNFDGRLQIYTKGNFSAGAARIVDINSTGLAESFGWVVEGAGDINNDGVDDYAVNLAVGFNGTTNPGSVRAYYGAAHPYPEDVRVFVNTTRVFEQTGPLTNNTTVSGFAGAVQSYLAAHQADINATGFILVPLSFNFSLGGALNVSNLSITYTVLLPPKNVTVTAPVTGSSLVISWSLQPTDGTLFSVWSNKSGSWAIVGNVSVPRTSFNDTNVTDGMMYYYYVTEWDPSVALQSAPSQIVSATPVDVIPPPVPQNVTIQVNTTAHSATIMWLPNGGDTVRYDIYRKDGDTGSFLLHANVSAPAFTISDAGLAEEVNFTYQVRAVDDGGLVSGFSLPVVARIPDLTAPPRPSNLVGVSEPSGTAVALLWDANTVDTVGYVIFRASTNVPSAFVEIGQTAGTSFTATGLQRNQTYYFFIEAIDKVGLRSPPTPVLSVLTVDTQPPNAPVLVAAEPLQQGNTVQISWTAAGDDLAGFRVFTNASGTWTQVLQVGSAVRIAVVTNLTDGVAAYFLVAAFDFMGLQGPDSNVLWATPRDTQRPGTPPSLLISAPPSGATLVLVWTAPTDADVAGYRVYFLDPRLSADYTLAASVNAAELSFTHRGLENGVSYSYQVSAFDEANNESPPGPRAVGVPRDLIAPSAPRMNVPPASTNLVKLPLSGTAEPGVDVELWVNGALQTTVRAPASGDWTAEVTLRKGDNAVYARAVDPSPVVDVSYKFSPPSETIHVGLDPDRPTVVTSSPEAGATGVDPAATLIVRFSESLARSSLVVSLRDADGDLVDGNLTYDDTSQEIRFKPNAPLAFGQTYTLSVSASDLAGNTLTPLSFSFTTRSASGGGGGGGGGFLPGFSGGALVGALGVAVIVLAAARRRAGK